MTVRASLFGKKSFLRENGLTLVLLLLFLISWVGHGWSGWLADVAERSSESRPVPGLGAYLRSPDFWSSTFENWESEFLQMGLFVLLTVDLRQRGSSESKPLEPEEEDEKQYPKRYFKHQPFLRAIYERSLSLALFFLFFLSFAGHAYFSWRFHWEEDLNRGRTTHAFLAHLVSSEFWFESFQNWQSEFLSVAVLVVLTIFLRHKGSAQSKPVDAPHDRTG